MKTIYVPVGLPASGKSTYYQDLVSRHNDVFYISPDLHLAEGGVYRGGKERRRQAWRQAIQKAHAYAARGQSFYFDATHLTHRSREQMLEVGARYGHRVVAIWFRTSLEVCRQRNADRHGDKCVPWLRMMEMQARLEPPTKREGFSEIVLPP